MLGEGDGDDRGGNRVEMGHGHGLGCVSKVVAAALR